MEDRADRFHVSVVLAGRAGGFGWVICLLFVVPAQRHAGQRQAVMRQASTEGSQSLVRRFFAVRTKDMLHQQ